MASSVPLPLLETWLSILSGNHDMVVKRRAFEAIQSNFPSLREAIDHLEAKKGVLSGDLKKLRAALPNN
ncbi:MULTISPECIES: hypothetical protein [Corallincola]|uniref:Uncharacterized protein n=2 Tax=Corallincola TaxID=1775176 RepID=A0ABY1WUC3_9GAMM|nr:MULTISPECIES: hypothetical protein [Corallincola]TAA48319.1 hypothetical protein EXY25_03555 [Corallincola spongiicola]TCI02376.1 hypothetical protein EZV61_13520 [Corallincola luteus]